MLDAWRPLGLTLAQQPCACRSTARRGASSRSRAANASAWQPLVQSMSCWSRQLFARRVSPAAHQPTVAQRHVLPMRPAPALPHPAPGLGPQPRRRQARPQAWPHAVSSPSAMCRRLRSVCLVHRPRLPGSHVLGSQPALAPRALCIGLTMPSRKAPLGYPSQRAVRGRRPVLPATPRQLLGDGCAPILTLAPERWQNWRQWHQWHQWHQLRRQRRSAS